SCAVGLAWHDRYLGRGFVPRRASWSSYALALRSFDDAGFFRQGLAPFLAPEAGEDELASVHSASYLAFLRELDARGEGLVVGRIHEHGGRFFPGTGAVNETGAGAGDGFTLNLPLGRGDGDAAFLTALDAGLARVRAHRPEILLVQFGTDGHVDDPFSHLRLSDAAYGVAAERAHALAHEVCGGALVLLGGGGYAPETVARIW